jgi:hypothetical protein
MEKSHNAEILELSPVYSLSRLPCCRVAETEGRSKWCLWPCDRKSGKAAWAMVIPTYRTISLVQGHTGTFFV